MSDAPFNFDLGQMKEAVESPTISFPPGLSHEERSAYIKEALALYDAKGGCPKCGCPGIHACIGKPIAWTPEDKARLENALRKIFKGTEVFKAENNEIE